MANTKPSIPSLLAQHNTGYHADGTIKNGRKLVARYYKCDRLTDETLSAIREHYPNVERRMSSPMYAPEIKNPVLYVPIQSKKVA